MFRQEEEPSCNRYSVLKSIRWLRPEQNKQVAQFDLLNHNPNDQRGLYLLSVPTRFTEGLALVATAVCSPRWQWPYSRFFDQPHPSTIDSRSCQLRSQATDTHCFSRSLI